MDSYPPNTFFSARQRARLTESMLHRARLEHTAQLIGLPIVLRPYAGFLPGKGPCACIPTV